jgi:hypothetical protein
MADPVLPSHCRTTALVEGTVVPEPRTRLGNVPLPISDSSVGRAVTAIDRAEQHEGSCCTAAV